MGISRTKVNALQDDDGSNTVGTLYKKQNVVDIYDDVDAYIQSAFVWTPRVYNAANYFASGAMTWTVEAGDQTDRYRRFEKSLIYQFQIDGASISGTPSTDLRILLPLGLLSAAAYGEPFYFIEGVKHQVGLVTLAAGSPHLRLLRGAAGGFETWTPGANHLTCYGKIEIDTTT
jgi:hypothetical protein